MSAPTPEKVAAALPREVTLEQVLHSGATDEFRAQNVAQALADQRAKYEAAADELDPVEVALSGVAYVAERIQSVTR